jgi:ribosomal-protein-serine acetyltransferase
MFTGMTVNSGCVRRGCMTTAVEALSRVALSMPGIERVPIRHDVAKAASAAVAVKAGMLLLRRGDAGIGEGSTKRRG